MSRDIFGAYGAIYRIEYFDADKKSTSNREAFVIVPYFNAEEALAIFKDRFPDRQINSINSINRFSLDDIVVVVK